LAIIFLPQFSLLVQALKYIGIVEILYRMNNNDLTLTFLMMDNASNVSMAKKYIICENMLLIHNFNFILFL